MKRKFVCGMLVLCLALSMAGCGKGSEEQQAVNYYQNELGLDKEDAEELAHELYGKDEEDTKEKPGVTEAPKETVVEPLPELVNSEWYEEKVQIYDMVFTNGWRTSADDATKIVAGSSEEDIRKVVAGSSYNVELEEGFDKNGELCLTGIKVDGKKVAGFEISKDKSDYQKYIGFGFYGNENCYRIVPLLTYEDKGQSWFDKGFADFSGFKTREDVLAYLSDNGFVEVDEEQACYWRNASNDQLDSKYDNEYADTAHYFCKGVQYIRLYKILKLYETDQEIEDPYLGFHRYYSGVRLNLVEDTVFDFNPDGTIMNYTVFTPNVIIIPGETKRHE